MILSPRGRALIEGFEHLFLTAYYDTGGVPTIGYGHTGPEVSWGDTCSVAQADAWLDSDCAAAVAAVNRDLTVAVNQNQFDALVSFTYNVGIENAGHSTLVRLLNGGQTAKAAAEFPKWDHVGSVTVQGLLVRRLAEQKLFLEPVDANPDPSPV